MSMRRDKVASNECATLPRLAICKANVSPEATMNMLMRARAKAVGQAAIERAPASGAALSPSVVRRGLQLSIAEGALSNIHITVCAGAVLTGFALILGAGLFELGGLAALPFIGLVFHFAGAYLAGRFAERRRMSVLSCGVGRSLWALLAALAFLPVVGPACLPPFLLVLAISQALIGITANAW